MESINEIKNKISGMITRHLYMTMAIVVIVILVLYLTYKYVPSDKISKMISGKGAESEEDEMDRLIESIRRKQKSITAPRGRDPAPRIR